MTELDLTMFSSSRQFRINHFLGLFLFLIICTCVYLCGGVCMHAYKYSRILEGLCVPGTGVIEMTELLDMTVGYETHILSKNN